MRRHAIILLTVLVLTTVVYRDVWTNGLVYEDLGLMTTAASGLPDPPRLVLGSPNRSLSYRSAWLDRYFFEYRPAGWHGTNLALHLMCGLLVFVVALQLDIPAVLAATIFLIHPMQVEPVAYLNGRGDVLSTMWILLSLALVVVPVRASLRVVSIGLSIACVTLAFASKESAVVGAGLLILAGWRHAGRLGDYVWPAIVAIGMTLRSAPDVVSTQLTMVAGHLDHAYDPSLHIKISNLSWAESQSTAAWRYLSLAVWPMGFSVDHDYDHVKTAVKAVALAGWLILPILLWIWRRPFPVVSFGLLWAWLSVLPRLVVPTPYQTYLNEHQMYLANVGIACALAWVLEQLCTVPA